MISIEAISAIAQILIATSVAYVAWQNYIINKDRFRVDSDQMRLNLYDRRYKVFEGFRSYFLSFVIQAEINMDELQEFMLTTVDTGFLFGEEVVEYRKIVIDNSIKLKQIIAKLERGVGEDQKRAHLAVEAEKLEKWFVSENENEKINTLFKKYLHFSNNLSN